MANMFNFGELGKAPLQVYEKKVRFKVSQPHHLG